MLRRAADDYCSVFDLTCRIPKFSINDAVTSGRLVILDVSHEGSTRPVKRVIESLSAKLHHVDPDNTRRKVTRICVPFLGSAQWGDIEPKVRPMKHDSSRS